MLILEAGSSVNFVPDVPVLGPMLQDSMLDWNYVTVPQKHGCKALKNRQSRWPAGKVFGGTFLLSDLIQIQGEESDYAGYVDGVMDYERDIGRYFRESQAFLQGEEVVYKTEFSELLKKAGNELNFDGFHHPNVSVKNGMRFTTATVYKNALNSNSTAHKFIFNAHVSKLVLRNGRIEKVEFFKGSHFITARARKAVILSAGAIGSPKILLQSGIGPKRELESVGIDAIINLPVGRHLIDHVTTGIDLILLNQSLGTSITDMLFSKSIYNYLADSSGPITMAGCDLVARFNVSNESAKDLQFMVIPVGINSDNGIHLRRIMNFKDETWWEYFHTERDVQMVSVLPVVLHPKSEGTVKLKSKDPFEKPLIDPNYLSHPHDKEVLYRGIRLIQSLLESNALKKFDPEINPKIFPGCADFQFDSRDYWMCYFEHVTLTSYHPAGTCRMGKDPKDSVVDHNFKVHGVDNLYVVDASVMPNLPSGNPIATILMLVMRFVDLMVV